MFPNAFLKTFWQMNLKPQVFVAMSFSAQYQKRYDEVLAPAIERVTVGTTHLKPYKVDLSRTGDSIITDIIDGIAHSQLFLADVSTVGRDATTGFPYRNGNVMYEVGIALACRQSSEVLIIRDDQDKFLFDVSIIPHKHINFTDRAKAIDELSHALQERVAEQQHVNDARVRTAVASLGNEEIAIIKQFGANQRNAVWGFKNDGTVNFMALTGIPRLLDKEMIELVGRWEDGGPAFRWTHLGYVAAQLARLQMPVLKADPAPVVDTAPAAK